MLSVIIRTGNGENVLLDVLRPLVAAAAEGIVRDVVFLDVGSQDGTPQIADAAGATFLSAEPKSSSVLARGLAAAPRGEWVLLLDQATVLSTGWLNETISFVERQERVKTARGQYAAVFRPEDEPELGSADLRRRLAVLFANRLLSQAKVSQGVLARRSLLAATAENINWRADDPTLKLPNLLRLRSRTHLALPMDWPMDGETEAKPNGNLSGATS